MPTDLGALERIFTHPDVQPWLRPPPLVPFDRAEVERLIERDARAWRELGYGPWACCERDGGAVIGRVGLQETTVEAIPMVELAWTVDPARLDEGLASEAAREAITLARSAGLRDLVAMTLPRNLASRAVAEGLGMAYEGKIEHAGLPHVLYRLSLA